MGSLIPLADNVWTLPGGANIGVLANNAGEIVLVDTGLNDTSAKRALRAVREELGGEIVAVLTTHAHADHYGGNATIVKRTGALVYAPAFDEAFLRYPLLQPIFLFGGADPIDSLRGNFLLADASPVDVVVQAGPLAVQGIELEAVPLFGHSPGQLGYLAGDVFFCADVVLPVSVLEKYRVPYLFSLTEHLAALERAARVPHCMAVPGHGAVLHDGELAALIDQNVELARRVLDAVLEIVAMPHTAEAVLRQLLLRFAAPVSDAPSFYLLQPTALAFLSYLHRAGQVRHVIRDGQSLWVRA